MESKVAGTPRGTKNHSKTHRLQSSSMSIGPKMQNVEKKKKEFGVDLLLQLELLESNIKKEIEFYGNDDGHNLDGDEESIHDIYRDGKKIIYNRLTRELDSIQQSFHRKFDLYDKICDANDETQYRTTEIDSLKLKKAQYELKYKKLIAEKAQLQNDYTKLANSHDSSSAKMDGLKDLKDQIGNHVLELNSLKEKNNRDEKSVNELKQLMKDLQESVEFSENEFSTNCLDKFDQIMTGDSSIGSNNNNANDIYKTITALLKQVEKDYEFNGIDPVDEERDHMELKHKLLSYEKARHEMNPILVNEDILTQQDKNQLEIIEEIKDLSEIKRLEDRIIKLLKNKNAPIEMNTSDLDKSTIELSDSYYKKAIVKARGRMVDKQTEYLNKEHELNSKTNDFYSKFLSQLETQLKQNSKEPF